VQQEAFPTKTAAEQMMSVCVLGGGTTTRITGEHIGRLRGGKMQTPVILLVAALTALPAHAQVNQSATQGPSPSEPAKTRLDNQGVSEPEFEGVFFRLAAGKLLPLERQMLAVKVKVSGTFIINTKATLDIPGGTSPVRFRAGEPLEFVVRSPLATSATDPTATYHLRRLEAAKGTREVPAIVGHASLVGATSNTTPTAGLLPLEFAHYGVSSYEASTSGLSPGEYAIGQAGAKTVFCFGVD
jgi:hypothetical protein